jgi:hypothetical protein
MNAGMSLTANLTNNQKVKLQQKHSHEVKLHLKKIPKADPSERMPCSN